MSQVRNNILVALADWCTRFTGVVDAHVGALAACLADPHALIRKQALALLACLLSKVLLSDLHMHAVALLRHSVCVTLGGSGSLSSIPTRAHPQAGPCAAGLPAVQGEGLFASVLLCMLLTGGDAREGPGSPTHKHMQPRACRCWLPAVNCQILPLLRSENGGCDSS